MQRYVTGVLLSVVALAGTYPQCRAVRMSTPVSRGVLQSVHGDAASPETSLFMEPLASRARNETSTGGPLATPFTPNPCDAIRDTTSTERGNFDFRQLQLLISSALCGTAGQSLWPPDGRDFGLLAVLVVSLALAGGAGIGGGAILVPSMILIRRKSCLSSAICQTFYTIARTT